MRFYLLNPNVFNCANLNFNSNVCPIQVIPDATGDGWREINPCIGGGLKEIIEFSDLHADVKELTSAEHKNFRSRDYISYNS